MTALAVFGGALISPSIACATVTCSAGGVGTIRDCNNEANISDIRTLVGWSIGVLLFALVIPVFSRTFRT